MVKNINRTSIITRIRNDNKNKKTNTKMIMINFKMNTYGDQSYHIKEYLMILNFYCPCKEKNYE